MLGVDAGRIARYTVTGAATARLRSFVKSEFFTFVHSCNMHRIRRFFMAAHSWNPFLCFYRIIPLIFERIIVA